MSLNLGNIKIKDIYLGGTKIKEAYLGSSKVYAQTDKWDIWDRTTYNDTSWQSTLTKSGSVGTVTISKASQFINMGATVDSFYSSNSLSTLNVNLTKHFKFNDITSLSDASTVYSTLSSSGVKSRSTTDGFLMFGNGKIININGNGHIISGLYCYSTASQNGGSFARVNDSNTRLSLNNFTFDRCLFRSNAQASAGFSMINGGAKFTTSNLNFNKCAVASESTSNYQTIMFGFLNSNAASEYNHTQISFYNCGFKGSRSWTDYSCGCGGISNWSSSPTFKAIWNNATYISPFKLGGNGTMKLYSGNRASTTYNGTCSYYNIGSGITAQGTSVNSESAAIVVFNSSVSNQDYKLVLDANNNLYHKCEL